MFNWISRFIQAWNKTKPSDTSVLLMPVVIGQALRDAEDRFPQLREIYFDRLRGRFELYDQIRTIILRENVSAEEFFSNKGYLRYIHSWKSIYLLSDTLRVMVDKHIDQQKTLSTKYKNNKLVDPRVSGDEFARKLSEQFKADLGATIWALAVDYSKLNKKLALIIEEAVTSNNPQKLKSFLVGLRLDEKQLQRLLTLFSHSPIELYQLETKEKAERRQYSQNAREEKLSVVPKEDAVRKSQYSKENGGQTISHPKPFQQAQQEHISQNPKEGSLEHLAQSNSTVRALRVFLCHSSGDKKAVRTLYKRLCDKSIAPNIEIDPWLDEEKLLPGQDWEDEIRKAVRQSDIVIVCLSSNSINKAGFIQKEIKFALDIADEQPEGAIFIIPLKFEECEAPSRLSRWHWVNFYEERGYERLIASLNIRAKGLGIVIQEK